MLLILAAIFLLIGIQGTPLIKFGSNSGSLELERRRRKRVEQALKQASEENSAEKAEGIVEGVKLVAPDLERYSKPKIAAVTYGVKLTAS
jgi:hypothetical protein